MDKKIYVPNKQRIWEQILQENYDLADIEHLGQQRMLNLIKRNYWWPEIKTDIKKYIQECQKSQQNKMQYIKKTEELYSLEIPQGP